MKMKHLLKIIIVSIIVVVLFYGATFAFLAIKGKDMLVRSLQGVTQKKVTIDYFRLLPPFNLKIKNLNIENLFRAKYIYISPSILGLFTGKIVINDVRVINPEFNYERFPVVPEPSVPSDKTAPIGADKKTKKDPEIRLVFKRVHIDGGSLKFTDHTGPTGSITIRIQNIKFNLEQIYVFPLSSLINFELNGVIPWQDGAKEGTVSLAGWINLTKKDMQATLKILNIDGIALYPYYATWVDLEKARIERAKLNFTSDVQGLNNDITAACHLELAEIYFKPRSPEEQEEKAEKIATAVLGIFKTLNQGKIVLDFAIKTKMDKPEFSFGNIKMAFEEKLMQGKNKNGFQAKDVLVLPGKLVEGTFKGAADLYQAFIGGAVTVSKEVRSVLNETFSRENTQAPGP
jgi:hypothetical protein